MSKASSELVSRLELRKAEVESLRANLLTLAQLSDELRTQVGQLSTVLDESASKLEASESTRQALQADLTATLSSLDESRRQLADLQAASDAAAHADLEALRQARGERDTWMLVSAGGFIAAVLAVFWGLSR